MSIKPGSTVTAKHFELAREEGEKVAKSEGYESLPLYLRSLSMDKIDTLERNRLADGSDKVSKAIDDVIWSEGVIKCMG